MKSKTRRTKEATAELHKQVIDLRLKGVKFKRIAEVLGVTPQYCSTICSDLKTKRRETKVIHANISVKTYEKLQYYCSKNGFLIGVVIANAIENEMRNK